MKKTLIGAIVGGVIIFIWQFLSHAALDLHRVSNQYTPKQDSIISHLSSQLSEDGQYFMPNLPAGASREEHEKLMKDAEGKPWALVLYHKESKNTMASNMIRGLLVNIIMVWMLCWILMKISPLNFGTVLIATLFTGFIAFLNHAYTPHIWYQIPGIAVHLIDTIVSWGLCGVWLGWWLNRKTTALETGRVM